MIRPHNSYCVAPSDADPTRTCGKRAFQRVIIENVSMCLCPEHVQQLRAEQEEKPQSMPSISEDYKTRPND